MAVVIAGQLLCAVSPRAQSREIDSPRGSLLPAGPIVEFARTGNDEADAAQVRSNFLAKVNPPEWECYNRETNPHLKKAIFVRAFAIAGRITGGFTVSDDELRPSCAAADTRIVQGAVRIAGQTVLAGLRQLLREAIRIPANADTMADALYGRATDNQRPVDSQASAQERLQAAAELVKAIDGADAARTFMNDPPLLQARRTAQVALTVTNSRRWPNAFMLGMSDAGEGSSMWYTLSHSYGANHPDVVGFFRYSDEEKGAAVQRWYADMFGQALRAADGQLSIDALARTFNDQPPQEPRAFVESVLGSAMAERYDRALQGKGEPGDSARDMVLGAFILRSVIPQLAMIAQ